MLQGDKTAVDELLTNPAIKSISFVGSTPIAQLRLRAPAPPHDKRVQALGGAKNHAVILPDADLDLAADAMVNAGFGSAGERCMAISAASRSGRSPTTWSPRSPNAPRTIKTGDGTGDADMGPLVTKAHRDKVASYIDAGEADGAKIVVDGRNVSPDGGADGFWLGPTLLDNVTPEMSVYTDEIFGPVLSVVRVETYDEALDLINANPYGNGTAIFTNDGGAARRFQNEVEVGMVGINVPIPVPMAYYSFGGWKASLFGDRHAHGDGGCALLHPRQRPSPAAGSTPATAASNSASRRTPSGTLTSAPLWSGGCSPWAGAGKRAAASRAGRVVEAETSRPVTRRRSCRCPPTSATGVGCAPGMCRHTR